MNEFKITTEQATKLAELAKAHNESIDAFIHVTLKEHFGTDTLNAAQWFEAQDLISRQGFYKKETGQSDFTASEVAIMKDLLRLSDRETNAIFLRKE